MAAEALALSTWPSTRVEYTVEKINILLLKSDLVYKILRDVTVLAKLNQSSKYCELQNCLDRSLFRRRVKRGVKQQRAESSIIRGSR